MLANHTYYIARRRDITAADNDKEKADGIREAQQTCHGTILQYINILRAQSHLARIA
jgi:hypothetical protein